MAGGDIYDAQADLGGAAREGLREQLRAIGRGRIALRERPRRRSEDAQDMRVVGPADDALDVRDLVAIRGGNGPHAAIATHVDDVERGYLRIGGPRDELGAIGRPIA